MSEEEKKAINQLKADTNFYDYELKNGKYIYELFKIEVYKKDVDVILNLTEKQQKEIEEYKSIVECIEEFKRLKRPVMELVHEMNKFEDEFVSKDKIREKIEEVSNGTYDAKIILEKLLEENNND